MNRRELRLLIGLVSILGIGGGGILVYQWFYKPLVECNATIKKLDAGIQQKSALLKETLDERKLLERARLMSLSPGHVARAEYDKYLYPLLVACKLEIDTFAPAPASKIDGPPQPPGSTAVKPGHQVVATQIKARGDIESVVKALEQIQKTPLMHRIKLLTIDRDTSSKNATDRLTLGMTVEALIVNKAEAHTDGPSAPDQRQMRLDLRLLMLETMAGMKRGPMGISLLPWVVGPTGPPAQEKLTTNSGYRQYADVSRKNIFNGLVPLPKEIVPQEVEVVLEDPPDLDVREYVRLDTTDPDGREAFFRNLVFKTAPIRVRSASWSGYDTFRVWNEYKTRVLVKGKVLRIDQRDVYFQVQEHVYGIHIGQSLYDAMRRSLSDSDMTRLKLTSLYDAAWGAAEAKEALQSASKQKKKGGR